jgi:hypothetical protein
MYFLLAGVVEKFRYLRPDWRLCSLHRPEDAAGRSHVLIPIKFSLGFCGRSAGRLGGLSLIPARCGKPSRSTPPDFDSPW